MYDATIFTEEHTEKPSVDFSFYKITSRSTLPIFGDWEKSFHSWLVVWLPWIWHFPRNIGFLSSSQLTKSYFSEGWPNHPPEMLFAGCVSSYRKVHHVTSPRVGPRNPRVVRGCIFQWFRTGNETPVVVVRGCYWDTRWGLQLTKIFFSWTLLILMSSLSPLMSIIYPLLNPSKN